MTKREREAAERLVEAVRGLPKSLVVVVTDAHVAVTKDGQDDEVELPLYLSRLAGSSGMRLRKDGS